MEPLLKEERQQRILAVLQENRKVTVPELSRTFGISEVTIRRDLHDLASNGHLVRAHRGALAAAAHPPEPPIIQRMSLEHTAKEAIAQAAVELVDDGDSIFIGSGSTMTYFARCLARRGRLTIITNGLNIAAELAALETAHTVVVTGGVLRPAELSLLGHVVEQALHEVRINKIFMGVQALSIEGGWMTDHLPEVPTTRHILTMSDELIILADHSKFGHTAAAFIAPINRLSVLVTDNPAVDGRDGPGEPAGAEFLRQAQARGVRVILAG